MRANRRVIISVVAAEVVVMVVTTVVLLGSYGADPLVTYFLGTLHAAALTIFYFTLRIVFLANDQDAVRQMRGNFGETNTRDELMRAKRRRIIWGWVDSIAVAGGDIDHLVVTKHSGVVAIDSKWRNDTIGSDIFRAAGAASKSAVRARSVLRHLGYLKREHVGRRRADANSIIVTPLVVLWGPIRHDVPNAARVEEVDFIAGPLLSQWLRQDRSEDISRRAAMQLLDDLQDFRREHEQADASTRTPHSPHSPYARGT